MAPPSKEATTARQGHSILITWNSAIIENTQDNISKSSVFIDADVLGCINMRHQTTFNALYSAPDEPCGCRNSHMHINEIFVSNDPGPGREPVRRALDRNRQDQGRRAEAHHGL